MSNEITLKQAIEKFIDAYKLRPKIDEKRISALWSEIVGEKLAQHSKFVEIREKKLYIKAESSVVRQELVFMRSRIKMLINRKAGNELVNEIVIL